MNLSMNQKQTHRHTEKTCGCQGGGGGWRTSAREACAQVHGEGEREHVSVTRWTEVRAQRTEEVQGQEPARPGLSFLMKPG